MAEKPGKELELEKRVAKLEAELRNATWQIAQMQKMGGFADSKTLSVRCTRIEERLALAELDGEMLKDVVAHHNESLRDHLVDRHGEDERSSAIDMTAWRRARSRLRVWAEKRGLVAKRRGVSDTRRDENRARPREAAPA